MSEAYSIVRTEMVQEQEQPPQARQEEDVPILFLHGVGSDKSVWRGQLEHFGRDGVMMQL